MKTRDFYLLIAAFTVSVTACKKDEQVASVNNLENSNASLSASTALTAPSYAVKTLYGSAYKTGNADGTGTNARFNQPQGIQIIDDGTLYVADKLNNAIRKISTAGVVSTVNLGTGSQGQRMTKPLYIGVGSHGEGINVIQEGNSSGGAYNEAWVFDLNGTYITSDFNNYYNIGALARNPYYSNVFYFSSGNAICLFEGTTSGLPLGNDATIVPMPPQNSYSAIAVGYNNVIYFSTNNSIYKYVYKDKTSHITARIYSDLTFTNITSIVLNKDSRTMYVADNGYIKRIDSGKLTVIAGPSGANNGKDGTRFTADVYAQSLALGKGENILYFTDSHASTIRQITLN